MAETRNLVERSISALLTGCTVVLVVLAIRQQFLLPDQARSGGSNANPRFVPSWESILAFGRTIGDTANSVRVVEFADFECPACQRFRETLSTVQTKFPNEVSITFVHFPLEFHRFAEQAAQAAESAAEQGAFRRFHDQVFDGQDSIGLLPWTTFGKRALIRDSVAFARCITAPVSAAIDSGKAIGARIGVRGTPTVLIEGWLLPRPPTAEQLSDYIRAFRRGKVPKTFSASAATNP
jgi:thiol-disulfide isomerase/thioredoxin